MGNIIFLAGQRRTACRHSKFLFHPFHWNLHGSVDHSRMLEYGMSLDTDLEMYAEIVAERTNGAVEQAAVAEYLKASPRILSPTEALEYRVIDAVDEAPMPADAVSWCVHS